MRDRPRKSFALTLSLVLHLAPLGWALISFAPELDFELEFELQEVELIDPDQLQGGQPKPPEPVAVPAPPPPAPSTPPAPGPKPEPPKPAPEPEKPASDHDLGKRHSEAAALGPTNSTFYGLLVPKKIRKLSFADKALDIMAPLPDFAYLVGGGGFDALRDFDHIVIASPDIRDVRQTFLAVDYKIPRAEVQRAIERAAARNDESVEWIEENGIVRGNPTPLDASERDLDPRFFMLLEDGIAVYIRPEFVAHVLAAESGDTKTAGNYVANLTKLRKFAAKVPTAGLQVVLKDLRSAVKKSKLPFPMPDTIELTAEADEDPELLLRLSFVDLVDAKTFELWWNTKMRDAIPTAARMVVGGTLDQLELSRDGTEVQLWSRFDSKQTTMLLGIIADQTAKYFKQSPEEIEALRRERKENWAKRKNGKLPPSVLGGVPAGGPAADDAGGDADDEPAETPAKAPEQPSADDAPPSDSPPQPEPPAG
ncbi:MAG: hypothetical protein IAG13_27400 [Deltaproteobacteria bacterium]|nr:hypothetical protein [Nannocystaceae bacterium]